MTPAPMESLDYQLLDFGDGRKLEQFGQWVVDRPSPAAERTCRTEPARWRGAHARYRRTSGEQGKWSGVANWNESWNVEFAAVAAGTLRFELQPSPFGHVGVFPEQYPNWQWIARRIQLARRPLKVLNLFAYTGGSTLAAAAAGAEVVHLDAARNIVDRARRNAELSGLAGRPIRWIAEEAVKFCRREMKRGNRYQAIILDPPSYGHGPQGESWKIGRDLPELLDLCGQLTDRRPVFLLATCHSPGFGPAELAAHLADGIFGHCGQPPQTSELALQTADGRKLPSGVCARWPP